MGGEHEGSAEAATAGAAGDEEAALQQAPQAFGTASAAATAAAVAAPIRDEMRVWERIAAAAFAADGSMEGWDSDSDKPKESKEEQYMRVRDWPRCFRQCLPACRQRDVQSRTPAWAAASWRNGDICGAAVLCCSAPPGSANQPFLAVLGEEQTPAREGRAPTWLAGDHPW